MIVEEWRERERERERERSVTCCCSSPSESRFVGLYSLTVRLGFPGLGFVCVKCNSIGFDTVVFVHCAHTTLLVRPCQLLLNTVSLLFHTAHVQRCTAGCLLLVTRLKYEGGSQAVTRFSDCSQLFVRTDLPIHARVRFTADSRLLRFISDG